MSVIAIASLLATQSVVTLSFQPKVGSSYKQSTTLAQTSTMGNSTTSMVMTTKILSFEGGYFKLENTPSNVTVSGGMGKNDTAKKAMSKPTTIYLNKQYKPKSSGKDMSGIEQMMGGMSGAMSGFAFPNKPVKVGETWTTSFDMGQAMGAAAKGQPAAQGLKSAGKLNTTYKLLKADANTVTVGVTVGGTMNMDMAGGKGGGQGMKMSMVLSGSGTSTFERNTGIPISSSMKTSMQMAGMQAFNMTMSMTSKRI
ncbi:MAG: DUF6263 family protein [Armatimonadota bacterium]